MQAWAIVWQKVRANWLLILQVLLALGAAVLLYQTLTGAKLAAAAAELRNIAQSPRAWLLLGAVLILAPINWALEAAKWKALLPPSIPLSYSRAFQAVLSGIGVSLWMPMRTGDFIGRAAWLCPADRVAGAALSMVGSLAQLAISLMSGVLAIAWHLADTAFPVPPMALLMLALVLAAIIGAVYLLAPRAQAWLPVKWQLQSIDGLTHHQQLSALGLAAIRYAVFASQFILILWALGAGQSYGLLLIYVSIFFFVKLNFASIKIQNGSFCACANGFVQISKGFISII